MQCVLQNVQYYKSFYPVELMAVHTAGPKSAKQHGLADVSPGIREMNRENLKILRNLSRNNLAASVYVLFLYSYEQSGVRNVRDESGRKETKIFSRN